MQMFDAAFLSCFMSLRTVRLESMAIDSSKPTWYQYSYIFADLSFSP
jgi:hypothetical protein